MNFILFLLFSAVVTFVYMCTVFVISLERRDNSIADIAWGIGIMLVAISTLVLGGQFLPKQTFVTALVIVWGVRLSAHVAARNWGRGEDFRYKKFQERWGKNFLLNSFLQVYMLQGFVLLIVAAPVILVNSSQAVSFTFFDTIGFYIWLAGFLFEMAADFQLLKFKSDHKNRGKIFTGGLFKFSRHPNYFGEFLVWWGIFLMAVSVSGGLFTIISPVLMTILLTRISGVPLLEEKYKNNAQYRSYVRRTSSFVPWIPKS